MNPAGITVLVIITFISKEGARVGHQLRGHRGQASSKILFLQEKKKKRRISKKKEFSNQKRKKKES